MLLTVNLKLFWLAFASAPIILGLAVILLWLHVIDELPLHPSWQTVRVDPASISLSFVEALTGWPAPFLQSALELNPIPFWLIVFVLALF